MKCLRCKSIRTIKFVDGFGERRIFCRRCGGSFLENNILRFNGQKNLQDFRLDSYYKTIKGLG